MGDLSWTSEKDQMLIEFVKKHEGLYNVKCADYRKTTLKRDLWRQIGKILNKTDIECIKRWGYVRDYYVRRKAKVAKGSHELARKRAELLNFLDGVQTKAKRSDSSQYFIDNNASEISNDFFEVQVKAESISDDEYDMMPTEITEESHSSQNEPCFDNFDETDHFFASMAKIVKKLPRSEQVQLRMQISSLVNKAELRNLSGNECGLNS